MDVTGAVQKWGKEQLEDQYLRLYDDFLTLKRHCCRQEEHIKKMATKLLRLAKDNHVKPTGRGVEKEEYEAKIANLEKRNMVLGNKVLLLQNQLELQRSKLGSLPNLSRPRSSASVRTPTKRASNQDDSQIGALRMARMQNAALEMTIRSMSNDSIQKEETIGKLKEEILMKDASHQKEIQNLMQQLASNQSNAMKENLNLIRHRSALLQKQAELDQVTLRLTQLDALNAATVQSNRQLSEKVEQLTRELEHTQNQQHNRAEHVEDANGVSKIQQTLDQLKVENAALRQSNELILNSSAMTQRSTTEWLKMEERLRAHIRHLEGLLRRQNVTAKQQEQSISLSHDEEFSYRPVVDASPPRTLDGVDASVFGEEIRRMPDQNSEKSVKNLEQSVDEDQIMMSQNVHVQQAQMHVEPEPEVNVVNRCEKETQTKLTVPLIEPLNTTISEDMVTTQAGTMGTNISNKVCQEKKNAEARIEFKIGRITLTSDTIRRLLSSIQKTSGVNSTKETMRYFCTWDFFTFEPQATPISQREQVDYNLAVRYPTHLDSALLDYLNTGKCVLEIYLKFSDGYQKIAEGAFDLRSLLMVDFDDNSHTIVVDKLMNISGTPLHLSGCPSEFKVEGSYVGQINYQLILVVPNPEIIRTYLKQHPICPAPPVPSNALAIRIESLAMLHGTISRNTLYCSYQFFDQPRHVSSPIVPTGEKIPLEDLVEYQIQQSSSLNAYLRKECLTIYLMEGDPSDPGNTCLGTVSVQLSALLSRGRVEDVFEITANTSNQEQLGEMRLTVTWTNRGGECVGTTEEFVQGVQVSQQESFAPTSFGMPEDGRMLDAPIKTSLHPLPERIDEESARIFIELASQDVELPVKVNQEYVEGDMEDEPTLESTCKPKELNEPLASHVRPQLIDRRNNSLHRRNNRCRTLSGIRPAQGSELSKESQLVKHLSADDVRNKKLNVKFREPSDLIFTSPLNAENKVCIEIHSLKLDKLPTSLRRESLPRILVEYRFLGFMEPLQTASCPISSANQESPSERCFTSHLNYTRTFYVDERRNRDNRVWLANILATNDPEAGVVQFTIRNATNLSKLGKRLATAKVNFPDMLKSQRDMQREDVPLHPITQNILKKGPIGQLCVTIRCLDALRAIAREHSINLP